MKINISDLLDDYTPNQDIDTLADGKKSINLSRTLHMVNKEITHSKGGTIMGIYFKNKLVAACLIGLIVLSLGGITANAATKGALFNSIKVTIKGKNGSNIEYACVGNYTNADGNRVYEYKKDGEKDATFTVTICGEPNKEISTYEIENKDSNTSDLSISSSIASDGKQSDKIVVTEDGNQTSSLDVLGIDVKKYNNYEPGTYEETNADGVTFTITVKKDGSIHIQKK